MNIEQYRALKLEQENQPKAEETPTPTVAETTPETKPTEVEPEPIKVEIDGKEVTIDELKNGYLRQSDYTKKTQEVARTRKETEEAVKFYEYLKQNPEAVQALQQTTTVPANLDPAQSKVIELEQKMYDMMLEQEIDKLSNKYEDFEVREVLEMARDKQLTNLEDAYKLVKSSKGLPSKDDLKEQLRVEILKEMKDEGISTKTIINDTSTQPVAPTDTVVLSPQEVKIAKGMGMSIQDYVQWRDIK